MSFRNTVSDHRRTVMRRVTDASLRAALRGEPSRDDLREMLAEAARNTAKLSTPANGENHASDY
jgi:hypothetical protein